MTALDGYGRTVISPLALNTATSLYSLSTHDDTSAMPSVGPETFTYRQMIDEMAGAMGLRRLVVPLPDFVSLLGGRILGLFLKDIVVTRHEISGLRGELMYTGTDPLGTTSFTGWLQTEAETLGRTYINDLERRR